jgi:hypothetical protein
LNIRRLLQTAGSPANIFPAVSPLLAENILLSGTGTMGMLGSAALIIASLQFVAFPIPADSDMIPLCARSRVVNIDVGRQPKSAHLLLFIRVSRVRGVDAATEKSHTHTHTHTHLSFSPSTNTHMHC